MNTWAVAFVENYWIWNFVFQLNWVEQAGKIAEITKTFFFLFLSFPTSPNTSSLQKKKKKLRTWKSKKKKKKKK